MLVVGGGPVGLASAVFLSARGVPVVLVEKHPGSSPHPRAVGWTPRTMELFAAVGLHDQIPQAEVEASKPRRVRVETLAGPWLEETPWTPSGSKPTKRYSPHTNARMSQDELEPRLRERARALGADVRMSTRMLSFAQDAHGVTAELRGPDGAITTLRASYLIAADGSRSSVRDMLGIVRSGRGHIATMRSVLFRAAIPDALRARIDDGRAKAIVQFAVEQPDFKALIGEYPDGRFILMFNDDEERDASTLLDVIRRALGLPDVDVEILATGRWDVGGSIADRFSVGRVFLAGDAAHALPPNRGGYGANTGIDDANNLAWKLAAVLSGRSTPTLLETYDVERRPIAWLRHDQIFARPDHAYAGAMVQTPILDDDAMELGQLYRSQAVLGASADLPPARRPDEWAGQPGTRAPHIWLDRDGARISTLDLFQQEWLVLSEDPAWCDAADALAIPCVRIGVEVRADGDAFREAFGIGASGATLVRPDGYVAWRARERVADPRAILSAAFRDVASLACA